MTATQLALVLGLKNPRRVRELRELGVLALVDGRYRLGDSVQRYVEHRESLHKGTTTEAGARQTRAMWQARKIELEVGLMQRELVYARSVQAALDHVLLKENAIFDGLGSDVAAEIVAAVFAGADEAAIAALIKQRIDAARSVLADLRVPLEGPQ